MKNRLLTLAGALALLAVFGKFYAVPVMAQVRAALVKNIDERGRTPYQQTIFFNCTVAQPACYDYLGAVPAGKRLVVEYVSASFDGPNPGYAYLPGPVGHGNIFLNILPPVIPGGGPYVMSQPVRTYYEAGESPEFFLLLHGQAVQPWDVEATITGYLVDLTQ